VRPTGAKGLNLAVGDVVTIARALEHKVATGADELLNAYKYSDTCLQTCLQRVWQAERFSYDMTDLLHTNSRGQSTPFEDKLQIARLQRIVSDASAETDMALAYSGFPL